MKRPTVLIFADYYLPGHLAGGPIQTIVNLISHLQDEITFKVITRNHELGSTDVYAGVMSGAWTQMGGADVFYVDGRPTPFLLNRLILEAAPAVLYLNSFFSRWYSMLPLLTWRTFGHANIKVLLSPRGEFSPGALEIKRKRKAAYIAGFRSLGVSERITWCASSELERTHIYRMLDASKPRSRSRPRAKVVLMPNIGSRVSSSSTDETTVRIERTKPAGELRLVFLSRISPMKNLKGALEMLGEVSVPVRFGIYGPLEDGSYWRECERIIGTLPANIQVSYRGAIGHRDVSTLLSQSDLLFFPTLGENFGHVILEALGAGCPVLLSDQTPWRDLQAEGAGWDLPLDKPDLFRDAIETAWRMDSVAAHKMRAAARAIATRYTSRSESVDLVRRALLSDD